MKTSLLEVALPLEVINRAGAAEKGNPKSGLPATSHLWWSRKPVSIARSILAAALLPDPFDDPEARRDLLDLVGRCAEGDAHAISEVRSRIRAAWPDDPPVVLDPFVGGGSIAYEAARLGLRTEAADLNPVAVSITRAITELPSRFANRLPGLAEELAQAAEVVRERARTRLESLYPAVRLEDGALTEAVSWLWARTVTCPNPTCRRQTPLLSSWDLLKKPKNQWHLRPSADADERSLLVRAGAPPADPRPLKAGRGQHYTCRWCASNVPAEAVRQAGVDGKLGWDLVAIQAFADPVRRRGRVFVTPTDADDAAAGAELDAVTTPRALDAPVPTTSGNAASFGLRTVADLMSHRQRLALSVFLEEVRSIEPELVERFMRDDGADGDGRSLADGGTGSRAYGEAVRYLLGICLSRWVQRMTVMTIHNRANGSVEQSFIQPAYSFYGEFAEANPFSGSTGSWDKAVEGVVAAVSAAPSSVASIRVRQSAVATVDVSGPVVVVTDPPYYDVFDYAALSTVFYAWLREAVGDLYPGEFSTILPPAAEQLIGGDTALGVRARRDEFHKNFTAAMVRLREVQDPRFPLVLWYAYRQREGRSEEDVPTGWEAMLQALLDTGYTVTGTWPVRTERPEGVKSASNSLASSIVLACRLREASAGAVGRGEFIAALRAEMPEALAALRLAAIAPVDLVQASIGPGMAIFSRYAEVVESSGEPMRVRTALALIHQVLSEVLDGEDGVLDADTRWAIKWFEQRGMDEGPFGEAHTLANALGIGVDGLARGGVLAAVGGKVRLLERSELPDDWDPALDDRVSVWEATQHLVKALEERGESAAADLLARLGPMGDSAQLLAYRLYTICERKRWAREAGPYNALAAVWGSLRSMASVEVAHEPGTLL